MSAIIVMAKAPIPRRVKTRLCPPLRPCDAAGIAEAALKDTLLAVAESHVSRRVLALQGAPGRWLPAGIGVIAQRSGDLGQRLSAALRDVGGPSLLIGMDTPQVTAAVLDRALEMLATPGTGAVLGLSIDGGWWALGVRRWWPHLFDHVPMSTSLTGGAQSAQLDALRLKTLPLPVLRDIDQWADAVAVAGQIPGSNLACAVDALGIGVAV